MPMPSANVQSSTITPNQIYISGMRFVRFIKVGKLLHLMAFGGILGFIYFGKLALKSLSLGNHLLFVLYAYLSIYGFTLPFFAELDARSRYQNYKIAKDLLHINGFQKRIIKPFLCSRCQRDAIEVAATDLNCINEMRLHFKSEGYRWYHILPRVVLKKPKTLLTKKYWSVTLFTPTYKLQNFLW